MFGGFSFCCDGLSLCLMDFRCIMVDSELYYDGFSIVL